MNFAELDWNTIMEIAIGVWIALIAITVTAGIWRFIRKG